MNYHGIIIAESLQNQDLLKKVKVLSTKVANAGTWHMYKVEVPDENIHQFAEEVANSLKDGHWYVHFYHESPGDEQLFVVFRHKLFNIKKNDFKVAFDYGLKMGFPRDQMDFHPRNVKDEKW